MEESSRTVLQDFQLASRKAEESALRRYQASAWLESFIGPLPLPLRLSSQPSELEFVACLRNGLVLCNLMNKIEPGIVPKVIDISENQPLPAYQYFENVRNFLVAVEGLNLPSFEASDLGKDSVDTGSTAKIVDCILSLKSYHEWKQWSDGSAGSGLSGSAKQLRSPMVLRSTGRSQTRFGNTNSGGPCRHLDMAIPNDKTPSKEGDSGKLEDPVIEALVESLLGSKENIDHNLLASFHSGSKDSLKIIAKIMSSCLQSQQTDTLPEVKSILQDPSLQESSSTPLLQESSSTPVLTETGPFTAKCKLCSLKRGTCNHWKILEVQERDLSDIKELLSRTKNEFEDFQSQLHNDFQALGSTVHEMSFAANGYQRVIKENRDLYNMVQDLKGNIRVYCRIRPIIGAEKRNAIDHIGDDGSLVVLDPLKPLKDARKIFEFNRVFGPTSTQDEVYKETQPLIRSVMDGYNVCIFAYGQTGSGKTHTMCGPSGGSSKDMGINYLALNDLFEISCTRNDSVTYDIQVQMVEIYNEQVRDLLTEESSTAKLEIRNCTSNGGLSLPDATMRIVKSSSDVLSLMKLGEMNRCVSSTALNNQSSRSHSVLTVHVHGMDLSGSILRSCLHLVDLAGSERVDKSEVTGDRLKEAQYINKSLSCLGDVITALAQKNSHIPYRNSKLTQLLQDSLGGHAKTLMFAHVSPEADSYGETISTLKFAQRVSTVELGAAHMNKESREVKDLKEQVESLKKALLSKDVKSPRPRRMSIENTVPKADRRMSIENTVLKTDHTPPRPRRMSIENTVVKHDRTPSRSRRLSIENTVVKPDRTPPRSRRLSIENSIVKADRTPPRVRRLSIENQLAKSTKLVNPPQNRSTPKPISVDELRTDKVSENVKNELGSVTTTGQQHLLPLLSPTQSYRSRVAETESRIRRPIIQVPPKTPEAVPSTRTRVYPLVTPTELCAADINKFQTPAVAMSTSKKGSHIKRSLHTIGKLITPSDKRTHQHPVVALSTTNINDKSPAITTSARTQRRQSLTGGQTSGLSRRQSLGEKSTEDCSNKKRNAKTPPPVHPSCKGSRQWF